jgi:aspartate/methionine/tyrosine aminotransferase
MDRGQIRFEVTRLISALRRSRLLILNSPANPTGGVLTPEDLEQIAWWAHRYDVLLFSDEVYERYQYEGKFVSIGSLPRARLRTLTANSLSKSHALAAHRVGWLAGHRQLLRACQVNAVLQCPFVPTLSQHLALAALRLPGDALDPIHSDFESRRHYVHERLQAMGLQPVWPAGAFFFWIPVLAFNRTGREFAEQLLHERGTLVLPGDLFGPGGTPFIRLSYAAEEGRLREGLKRLADFVRHLAPVARPIPLAAAA